MAILAQLNDKVVSQRFELGEKTGIGRLADNEICIDSMEVSAHHARIERLDQEGHPAYFIEDLGSTNHTFVNETPVTRAQLRHQDVVRVGWVVFKFIDEQDPDHRKTSKIHKSWIPGVYYTR